MTINNIDFLMSSYATKSLTEKERLVFNFLMNVIKRKELLFEIKSQEVFGMIGVSEDAFFTISKTLMKDIGSLSPYYKKTMTLLLQDFETIKKSLNFLSECENEKKEN